MTLESFVPTVPAVSGVPDDSDLREWDNKVNAAEGEGLAARWHYGKALLERRVGEQLPRGLLAEECAKTGRSRRELQFRMAFAVEFPEVRNALHTFSSWHDFVNRPKNPRPPIGPIDAPSGLSATIVADPPWQYDNKATRGAAEDHYNTMTVDELCALPVKDWSTEKAHLYLWTTNAFLQEAFDVVEAWGFEYKTTLVWVKPQIGMGNYFRSSAEYVLFGVKGGLRTRDCNQPNWFQAPRQRHSQKPGKFFDLVETASFPPYLEMFARQRRLNPEWDYWGNEA